MCRSSVSTAIQIGLQITTETLSLRSPLHRSASSSTPLHEVLCISPVTALPKHTKLAENEAKSLQQTPYVKYT